MIKFPQKSNLFHNLLLQFLRHLLLVNYLDSDKLTRLLVLTLEHDAICALPNYANNLVLVHADFAFCSSCFQLLNLKAKKRAVHNTYKSRYSGSG